MPAEPIRLHDALDAVVRALRPPDAPPTDIAALGGVFNRWDEAVGPAIALHARPVRLEGTELVVEVDESAWSTHIKFFTDEIIERLREVAGAHIDTIHVRVGAPFDSPRRARR